MARVLRLGARALAVLGVLVTILAVRAVGSARAELGRGDALREAGDLDAAILAYRRAARWYAPGNPYVPEALDRLAAIAEAAEAGGDRARALAAWRSVHGAIQSSRSFYVPHRDRLTAARDEIARLVAEGAPAGRAESARRRTRERLDAPERPRVAYALLALAGWIAWTAGAFVFAQTAIDEEDRLLGRPARLWGTVVVAGFGTFVLGLALA
ncbi:MAG: hypothetical protein KF729_04215 [Sandaracinaceae bacterium]|nr:hypothetical protein [Sandaracinaceae bacterium]